MQSFETLRAGMACYGWEVTQDGEEYIVVDHSAEDKLRFRSFDNLRSFAQGVVRGNLSGKTQEEVGLEDEEEGDGFEDSEGEAFDTPEELIEHHRRGGMVDNCMLQHAYDDLPRPTPREAAALHKAKETPRIGFAFDNPQDVIRYAELGGTVTDECLYAMYEGVVLGREFALGEPALISAWYEEEVHP